MDNLNVVFQASLTTPVRLIGPQPMRTLDEIRADILSVERETEGLLAEIIGDGEAV